MTSPMRLEHELPVLLEDLYLAGTPDYRDDLLQQVRGVRQRPAWTFPERWLPMDLATRRVPATGMPWRALGVLALLALLIAATLAIYVGSQARLPAPFGFARNGQIAYTLDGDVYVRDSIDGSARALIADGATDVGVAFSPLGDRLAVLRSEGAGESLWVAGADGRDPARLGGPYQGIDWLEWSPDQATIALGHVVRGLPTVTLVATDSSGERSLAPFAAMSPTWRPPDGGQLLFRGQEHGSWGFYLVDLDGGPPRRLDLRQDGLFASNWDNLGPAWSPSGDRLAFMTMVDLPRSSIATPGLRIHVATLSPAGEVIDQRPLEFDPTADDELNPTFTPDGDHLVFQRRMGPTDDPASSLPTVDTLLIAPADGSAAPIDLGIVTRSGEGIGYTIAPDGTSLIAHLWDTGENWVIDPVAATARLADFRSTEGGSWQRRAP